MKYVLTILATAGILAAQAPKKDPMPRVTAGEPSYDARTVAYHLGHAVLVNAQIRWTTSLILPGKEKLMDVMCGDKDNWTINALPGANYVSVKPDTPGLKTNLTLVMESGNAYIFVLNDVSQNPSGHADTQVIVNLDDGAMISALNGKPKFVPADQVDAFRQEAEAAKRDRDIAQQALQKAKEEAAQREQQRAANTARLRYKFDQKEAAQQPFGVKDIWASDGHTFITANTTEAPALYEMKDGKPALCNWDLRDGTYFVPHVVERGYLQVGKKKLTFTREQS